MHRTRPVSSLYRRLWSCADGRRVEPGTLPNGQVEGTAVRRMHALGNVGTKPTSGTRSHSDFHKNLVRQAA